ncbi:MAG: hypothetical protein U9Q67_04990 [Patescibacteria group bacterium]|nr:hypothetical protein [Patescibacteria group bacterium]
MRAQTDLLVLTSIENIEEIVKDFSPSVKLTKGHYFDLEFHFKDNKVQLLHCGRDIKDFSTVWLSSFNWGSRDLAYAVKLYLDHFNTPHTFVEKSTSKITDQFAFVFGGIPTPNTFFINRHNITDYADIIEKTCGYPMVIKDIKGSRGKYSAYVKDRQELLKKLSELPRHRKYLFQEFIPNDYDWGVLVANGEVSSAEKSYHKNGEFRNNACNGAKEVFVETADVPETVKAMAVKASKVLGLSWSRADIIVDKNTGVPHLLEVNRCPGITSGTSEVIGARHFLKLHLKLINGKD